LGAVVGALAEDLKKTPREVEAMTWWDLRDINAARKRRAEATKQQAEPKRRATMGSLMAFGGIAAPR
jgi:hypothetical protein